MNLNQETIDGYKKVMSSPQNFDLPIPSLEQCIEPSEEVIPKDELFAQYVDLIKRPLPKLIFYIIFDELYSDRIAKAKNGSLGYSLKIKHPPYE